MGLHVHNELSQRTWNTHYTALCKINQTHTSSLLDCFLLVSDIDPAGPESVEDMTEGLEVACRLGDENPRGEGARSGVLGGKWRLFCALLARF